MAQPTNLPDGPNNWLLRLIAAAFWNRDGTRRAVTTTQARSATQPAAPNPRTADGAVVFNLAEGEVGFIQNLSDDAPLGVQKGSTADSSNFHLVLACGLAVDDGNGDKILIDDWIGDVSVASTSGGSTRYVAWKQ